MDFMIVKNIHLLKERKKEPNQNQTLSSFLLKFSRMKGIDCRKIAEKVPTFGVLS